MAQWQKSHSKVPKGTIELTLWPFVFQISQSQCHHEHPVSSRASCEVNTSLGDWASLLWASCLFEYIPRPMSAPCAWYCVACSSSYQFVSMPSHPSDNCHHRGSVACFCPPSPRFSLTSHPSRCQALVHSTSPLALWPGLPSNNFISFPPLSRRHAPTLTIGWCFLPEKKKSAGLRRAGWEPNNSWQCARHQAVILKAATGMYGPEVTHKRPACGCSCIAGNQGTCRLN